MPALSVLIPTLNEAEALPLLLADLVGQRGIDIEVIVADGGSVDGTAAIATQHGARAISTPRGRAAQLNAAVAAARAAWLLCLHADSRLHEPDQLRQALEQLIAEQAKGGVVAGHWPLCFRRTQPGHAALFRQLEAKSASNRPGTVNGDQGLLIHSETLAALGGFDQSLPFFEDQRLAGKVFAQGRFLLLPGVLQTSARRFEAEGHVPRMVLMALIVGAEAAGLHDWLASLPALYREQKEASGLRAAPFIHALLTHIGASPRRRQREIWDQAGRLVAANAWQLAQWRDAQHQDGRWLARFDALLAPLFATRLASRGIALVLPLALRLLARVSG
ncbi:MAG: glycosyltransferase [Pseudomonadota bacterium]